MASPFPRHPRGRRTYTPRQAAADREEAERNSLKTGTPVSVKAKHCRYGGESGVVINRREKRSKDESTILTVRLEGGDEVLVGEKFLIDESSHLKTIEVENRVPTRAGAPAPTAGIPMGTLTPYQLATPALSTPGAAGMAGFTTPGITPRGGATVPSTPRADMANSFFLGEAMKLIESLETQNRIIKMPSYSVLRGMVNQMEGTYQRKKEKYNWTPSFMWKNSDKWFVQELVKNKYVRLAAVRCASKKEEEPPPTPITLIGVGRQIVWGFNDRGAYIQRLKQDLHGVDIGYQLMTLNGVNVHKIPKEDIKRIFKEQNGRGIKTRLSFLDAQQTSSRTISAV